MPEHATPYTPGRPIDDPNLFCGRRELLASIRDQLVKGRRVFLVAGAPRMGKTSLLRQLPLHLSEQFLAVQLGLREMDEGLAAGESAAPPLPLARLAEAIWRAAAPPGEQPPPRPPEVPESRWFLDDFWPAVRRGLRSRTLVLLLDDADGLPADPEPVASFLAFLEAWRDREPDVAFVLTAGVAVGDRLLRDHPRLFGNASAYVLGSLSSEEAIRLITWPVEGVITYDYGVPRRLVEITSGQPHYLHLLCFEIVRRCAPAGWVNQRDVDAVVADVVAGDMAEFRQVWDESTPPEQAVLAALVSLRGARGVATVREVEGILVKAGARVSSEQVKAALERLAARQVLERLGALAYRFRVALLREWLDRRLDLMQVVRETRWATGVRAEPAREQPLQTQEARGRQRSRGRRLPVSATQAEAPPASIPLSGEGEEGKRGQPRPKRWPWAAAAGLVVLGALAVGGWALWRPAPAQPRPSPSPTAVASVAWLSGTQVPATAVPPVLTTATSQVTIAPAVPTASPSPLPTLSPSPTAPLILTRPVPAIAYLSRVKEGMPWTLYVMSSDGSNRLPLLNFPCEFLSAPSWSPDGSRLAFVSDQDGRADIWVVGSDGSEPVNLTRDRAKDHSPAWSPDGQWLAFSSVRDSPYWEVYLMRADGSDVRRLTWWDDASDLTPSWSPDGEWVAFASRRDGNWEIYAVRRDGTDLTRLTDHPADDTHPAWSPDGTRIAFESTRAGYADIFVLSVAGGEPTNLTRLPYSTERGATWSPDGGRIAFYSDRDHNWDIYSMASDGSGMVKLTGAETIDQLPAWRP